RYRAKIAVARRSPVERIGEDRRPRLLGQVHADLMRTPRLEAARHQRDALGCEPFIDLEVGDRDAARIDSTGEAKPRTGMSAVQRFDPASDGDTESDASIDALHAVRGKLLFQPFSRAFGLGDDEDAARVLVEPVNDARAKAAQRVPRVERRP